MGIEHTQNFLHSEKLVANLLSMSNLSLEDTVIEIGPGKGIITKMLAEKCKSVVAVEKIRFCFTAEADLYAYFFQLL